MVESVLNVGTMNSILAGDILDSIWLCPQHIDEHLYCVCQNIPHVHCILSGKHCSSSASPFTPLSSLSPPSLSSLTPLPHTLPSLPSLTPFPHSPPSHPSLTPLPHSLPSLHSHSPPPSLSSLTPLPLLSSLALLPHSPPLLSALTLLPHCSNMVYVIG